MSQNRNFGIFMLRNDFYLVNISLISFLESPNLNIVPNSLHSWRNNRRELAVIYFILLQHLLFSNERQLLSPPFPSNFEFTHFGGITKLSLDTFVLSFMSKFFVSLAFILCNLLIMSNLTFIPSETLLFLHTWITCGLMKKFQQIPFD